MNETISVAEDQLRSIVERVERLHEDRKAIADDISEVFKEAKGNGFDVAVLKRLISDRAKPAAKRAEFEALLDLYNQALEGTSSRACTRAAA